MTIWCSSKSSRNSRGLQLRRRAVGCALRVGWIVLVGMLLTAGIGDDVLMAQTHQRLPLDMTEESAEQPSVYSTQRWQDGQRRPGFIRPAMYTELKETPPAQSKSDAEPFIAASHDPDWELSESGTEGPIVAEGFFVQLGTWTVIVLCLCVLTILGIRRWQRSRGMLPDGIQSGRVIDTLTLGPGKSISLIQIQGLRALVGCDASGIRTIAMAAPAFDEAFQSAVDENDVGDVGKSSVGNQALTGG